MKRPSGIVILSVLSMVFGLYRLSNWTLILFGLALSQFSTPLFLSFTIIGILLALAYIINGYGLFFAKKWSYALTIIIAFVTIILSTMTVGLGDNYIMFPLSHWTFSVWILVYVIIGAVVVYYITRGNTRKWLGIN